ncbi:hypothetical protein KVR01_006088 [Diaporthe batatas]|uniref:uncharacterized protein n=1 Tax=Diaporthe batatas TaxID=748121 RepID=UPI001D05968D|nr:uncharacterized protein KVR01_006088 [Diaporthe batatas]KAG8164170.1 hypothetical protein KVR01_006088 [Diaporthe batatas]
MTLFCVRLLFDDFNLFGLVVPHSRNLSIDFLIFRIEFISRCISQVTSLSLEILELIEHSLPPILVACGVSFTAPGMWDALNNLGAGGAAEPYAVSAANALVYGLFFLVCIAAGAINNRIGLKWGLALGSIGYPIYGAGLYVNSTSAVTCSGSVSTSTYIAFIVIMCLGLPIAVLLSPADKVWRRDGTRVVTQREATFGAEFRAVWGLLGSPRILLLLPAFFISYFYNGLMSTWLTTYFTVRARAFSSFFTNFAGIFSSFIIASLLDRQGIPIRTRARAAFCAIRYYAAAGPGPVFDWFRGGFGASYALVFFWQFAGQAFQQFLYWLVGQYTTDLSSVSRHTGILRGFEALGQTVAWAMQSEARVNHFVSIGINFGVLLLTGEEPRDYAHGRGSKRRVVWRWCHGWAREAG